MLSAPRGSAPREGLECWVDEDGPYWATGGATPRAAGRQVWGPPFLERRQYPPGPRHARTWLSGEAKGQVRSAMGPNSLRPRLSHGDELDVGVSSSPRCLDNCST